VTGNDTFPNLFAFACGAGYQIGWSLGITGAMAEMLLQSHADEISLVPAIPADWAKAGSFRGLRARGGLTVDCGWKDGRVTACRIVADKTPAKQRKGRVRVDGESRKVTPGLR
jgi:alpha-L-fucosidase 2